jgi:hypothetical protein
MPTRPALILGLFLAPGLVLAPARGRCAEDRPRDVSIEVTRAHLDLHAGKDLVARYVIDPRRAKPYFWPLNVPSGEPIARGWPMTKAGPLDQKDHVHQKSAWFCYGDVIPERVRLRYRVPGIEGVDFWSEAAGHGRIVCTRVGPVEQGKGHAQVTTWNEWRTVDGVPVLGETRTIHLYDLGAAWLLVLDIDLHAGAGPVTFGDTKEGALGVRVRGSVTEDRGKGRLTNAEGKVGEGAHGNRDRGGCWGLVSAWCDYSGPVDGRTAGIALFADPGNPYPTCWHSRGYGLMAANPFGRAKSGFPDMKGKTQRARLARGAHLKLRYGLYLHTGDVKQGKVAEGFDDFVKRRGQEGW